MFTSPRGRHSMTMMTLTGCRLLIRLCYVSGLLDACCRRHLILNGHYYSLGSMDYDVNLVEPKSDPQQRSFSQADYVFMSQRCSSGCVFARYELMLYREWPKQLTYDATMIPRSCGVVPDSLLKVHTTTFCKYLAQCLGTQVPYLHTKFRRSAWVKLKGAGMPPVKVLLS
jgi:hypothetical protein